MNWIKTNAFAISLTVLLLQGGVYYTLSHAEVIPDVAPLREFPGQIGSWRGINDFPIDQDSLDQLRPDDYLNRAYQRPGAQDEISLFLAYFRTQRNGFAPHSPKNCLPGAGWQPVSSSVVPINVGQGQPSLDVNWYVVEKGSVRLLVIYWFQQAGRSFVNEIVAQFYALPDLLFHGRTDIALVRVILPAVDQPGGLTDKRGIEFTQQLYPVVKQFLH